MEFVGSAGIYTLVGILVVIGLFLVYCIKKVQ